MRRFLVSGVVSSILAVFMFLSLMPSALADANLTNPAIRELTQPNWLRSGITAYEQGDYQTAVAAFSAAIEQGETMAVAYSDRCLANLALGNHAAALADCTQALERNPDDSEAYLNRGLASYRLGNYAAAVSDYAQLLQINPLDFRAYYNRGLALTGLQNYQAAILDFEQALRQVSPSDPVISAEILVDRGLAQLPNDPQQAIADFTTAIQLNHAGIRALYNRGCAHHQQQNLMAAIEDFSQVLQLAPDYAEALLSRGWIRYQQGETVAAVKDLQQAADCFCHQGMMVAYQKTLNLLGKIRSPQIAVG
ncbi:MAG TPA: tetratricopeptide repeat protein [Trichocoleus sp.]|jgi:tetratricopeptide (TPR) repeat protein